MNYKEQRELLEESMLSVYAVKSKNTKGRQKPLQPCPVRTEFQRDRDRIIHSKSFRRLMHKTQVFLAPEGDHYRTRLTHTLEVSQIARTIARALRLNEDLTEAIALGHDLGHTPFGHSGEAVLNEICPGGFRHFEQSLRVVDYLEGENGLNLTLEVRDGILNHAGDNEAQTLEGKIIKLADRIAYINHDIDDALRAGIIKDEQLPKHCIDVLGKTHGERIHNMIEDTIKNSVDSPEIKMSDAVHSAMLEMRAFMFDSVYTNRLAKAEEEKAKNIIKVLFETFMKHPNYMKIKKNVEEERYRAVCDYIAGMTDNYAIFTFEKLFVPKSWKVK